MRIKKLVAEVTKEVILEIMDGIFRGTTKAEPITCKYCGSTKIYKYGHDRKDRQRYLCPTCNKVFLDIDSLKYMRVPIKELGDIMGQYYGGMSLKELKRQYLQQHDKALSRSSFHRWLTKFSKIAVDEADKYHPKVGDKWIADECVLKIGGKNVWCWDIIDADTRFLLATRLSLTRTTKDARELMEKASRMANKIPKLILTDALRAYVDGIELAFGAETKHVQSQPFTDANLSTNKIERWHSTLRMREDIMRGLKSIPTAQALLDGWLVHYNFFRPHESLDNLTPAEEAGLKFPFRDWLEVIEGKRPALEVEAGLQLKPKVKHSHVSRKQTRHSRIKNSTAIRQIRK